jgi:predicted secreted protein
VGEVVNFPKNLNLVPSEIAEKSADISVVDHHHYHHYPEENTQPLIVEEYRHIGMFYGFFHVLMAFVVMTAWLIRIIPLFFSFLSSIAMLVGAWLIWRHWGDPSYHAVLKLFSVLFSCFVILLVTENYKSPLQANELVKYFVFLLLFISPIFASADTAKIAVSAEQQVAQRIVHVGETFSISLPANRTTGYEWKLAEKPKFLKLISSSYAVRKDCKKGMTGCGGDQTFKLKAIHLGSGKITIHYLRPWEKSFAKTKVISVRVERKK